MVLTHYTRGLDAVLGILANGFAWAPLPRNLIQALVTTHDWGDTEPQQHGMISFTDHTAPAPSRHLEDFGGFGIQVEPQWAASKGANRVTYLEERGPLFEAMRELFSIGYAQATRAIRHPDDGMWRMAYVYKPAAAAFGAPLWAHLLTIYEYLEPAEHAYQSEWRVVHPTGVGNLSRDTTERIQNVSPPQGWAKFLHVLPINPADVIGFVCPNQACAELAARLPDAFRNKPVVAYDG